MDHLPETRHDDLVKWLKMSCILHICPKKSSLRKLISKEDWDKVRMRLQKKVGWREACRTAPTGMTALHLACGFHPPADVVGALLSINPKCGMTSDIFGRLPLHEACKYAASREVVDLLLDYHPLGAFKTDQRGMTPLHHAVFSACVHGLDALDVIVRLSILAPGAIGVIDDSGHTPRDIAAIQGGKTASAVVNYLSKVERLSSPRRSAKVPEMNANRSPIAKFDSRRSASNARTTLSICERSKHQRKVSRDHTIFVRDAT